MGFRVEGFGIRLGVQIMLDLQLTAEPPLNFDC